MLSKSVVVSVVRGDHFKFLAPVLVGFSLALNAQANDKLREHVQEADIHVRAALDIIAKSRTSVQAVKAENSSAATEAGRELEGILQDLESDAFRSLQGQVQQLFGKTLDVAMDATAAKLRAGDQEGALRLLGATPFRQFAIPSLAQALKKPPFDALRDKPEYATVLAAMKAPSTLGSASPIGSGYREVLGDAEKIGGLSLFWAEVRRSFVHLNKVSSLNWDGIFLDYVPRVLATKSVREYYEVLMTLPPLLNDSHVNIYPPDQLQHLFYSRPPIRTAMVDGRVIVMAVMSARLKGVIDVGDELTHIDEMPVPDFVKSRVAPYVSYSTEQDRNVRLYGYQLLSGERGTTLQLKLLGKGGIAKAVALTRGEPSESIPPAGLKRLAGDILYIPLSSFQNKNATRIIEENMDQILASKGLILDVRDNGGGSSSVGHEILTWLTATPIPTSRSWERREGSMVRSGENLYVWQSPEGSSGRPFIRKRPHVFAGPVSVLIGPRTFSAAEDFVAAFQALKRGKLIGKATAGSTGQPMQFKLPAGGLARITVKHDMLPNGKEFVGIGIEPDVEIGPSIEDIRNGKDVELEAAQALLSR